MSDELREALRELIDGVENGETSRALRQAKAALAAPAAVPAQPGVCPMCGYDLVLAADAQKGGER